MTEYEIIEVGTDTPGWQARALNADANGDFWQGDVWDTYEGAEMEAESWHQSKVFIPILGLENKEN